MRHHYWGVASVAVVAAVALLSGGCASSAGHAGALPVEKHDLVVGAVPVADAAALYIAEQQGLFAAQGLNVKIETVVSGADAIAGSGRQIRRGARELRLLHPRGRTAAR